MPSILLCTFPVIVTKYAYEFRNKKRQEDALSGAEDSDPSGTPTIKLSFVRSFWWTCLKSSLVFSRTLVVFWKDMSCCFTFEFVLIDVKSSFCSKVSVMFPNYQQIIILQAIP